MTNDEMNGLWKSLKDFLSLKVEYIKLTAVEKLIIILSAVTFIGVIFIFSACALFFLSSAIVTLIDTYLNCIWASNLIMAALIIILIIVLVILKKSLIINPISKFITKLFLNPPQK